MSQSRQSNFQGSFASSQQFKQQLQQQQQLNMRQNIQNTQLSQLSQLSQASTRQLQYREALVARQKLNHHKSFNVEDDLEFCPAHIDHRAKLNAHNAHNAHKMSSSQMFATQQRTPGIMSPYSTPVKTSVHTRAQGFLSPQLITSPQLIYTSPQGIIRKVEVNPGSSPMFNNHNNHNNHSHSLHW